MIRRISEIKTWQEAAEDEGIRLSKYITVTTRFVNTDRVNKIKQIIKKLDSLTNQS